MDPATVTLCPAEPLEGLSDEITGGPLAVTAAVEEVEVEVETGGGFVAVDGAGAEVGVRLPPPVRGLVDG